MQFKWSGAQLLSIGVPGPFFRGVQQFLSAKPQSCSAKKISSQGAKFSNSVLPSWCAMLLCHTVLPSHKIGQKLLNNGQKIGKNGKKIRQIGQKPDKHSSKAGKIWRKRGILAIFCSCTFKVSNSFLQNWQFLFCQATHFCSAKLNTFARGGPRPPRPPPKNAYDTAGTNSAELVLLVQTEMLFLEIK